MEPNKINKAKIFELMEVTRPRRQQFIEKNEEEFTLILKQFPRFQDYLGDLVRYFLKSNIINFNLRISN